MRPAAKIMYAVCISCMIALALAFMPGLHDKPTIEDPDSHAVISLAYGSRLNDENLVDYVARIQLNLGIRKLDWREPLLYVDLFVRDYALDREHIFADIREISIFALQAMKNVENVMMRVYDGRENGAAMLLAVSADDSRLGRMQTGTTAGDVTSAERFVREWFQVQETARWSFLYGQK